MPGEWVLKNGFFWVGIPDEFPALELCESHLLGDKIDPKELVPWFLLLTGVGRIGAARVVGGLDTLLGHGKDTGVDLPHVRHALAGFGRLDAALRKKEDHGCQDGDDDNRHHELNESETSWGASLARERVDEGSLGYWVLRHYCSLGLKVTVLKLSHKFKNTICRVYAKTRVP